MYLKSLELMGFKSFGKKSELEFSAPVTAVVGPNGSGKSNCAEAFRFVLGEQSIKNMRGKRGEDLIWGGSTALPRSNRASVKVTFDNTKRLLDVDFDEVVLERVVFRDGTNEYLINGSKVRLKDVAELLAGANVGASGHHMISQGEADRVLSATPRERRHMIEDALGLRVYQYKKEESVKKLTRTEENRKQVELLRKENAPHLLFMERQIKKIEKAQELRTELVSKYAEYLRREEDYLSYERELVSAERVEPTKRIRDVRNRIVVIREELADKKKETPEHADLRRAESALVALRHESQELVRQMGRLEGQIAFEERRIAQDGKKYEQEEGEPVPYRSAKEFWDKLTGILDHAHASNGEQVEALKRAVFEAQKLLRLFVKRFHVEEKGQYVPDTSELDRLMEKKAHVASSIAEAESHIMAAQERVQALMGAIEAGKEHDHEKERKLYAFVQEETELRGILTQIDMREQALVREEEAFKHELREGSVLIGREIMQYREKTPNVVDLDANSGEDRSVQAERKRTLEKIKIRLEEMGGANVEDLTREYREAKERDDFLARELNDLASSEESLRNLLAELERELASKFDSGVRAIGSQFSEFFSLMFGGGSASLVMTGEKKKKGIVDALMSELLPSGKDVEDEEESEQGVEIEVSLPKKRVQSLMMLSGGERTLTSIALIFAMSQVNPPPFIILDETDAALDEANSRRYGDMITQLSQKSQLILITHNRETMSRAGILYGITMGMDGVSKILSVKFDEAVSVAK
ncbi:MAG: AAA family ATPase [Candidatus Pacebacteria bacterium]|nr:AAA family ATPase [Candidatus Paceibacterota bacterium]